MINEKNITLYHLVVYSQIIWRIGEWWRIWFYRLNEHFWKKLTFKDVNTDKFDVWPNKMKRNNLLIDRWEFCVFQVLLTDSHFSTLHLWLSCSDKVVIGNNSCKKPAYWVHFVKVINSYKNTIMRQTLGIFLVLAIAFQSFEAAPDSSSLNAEEERLQDFLLEAEEKFRSASEQMSFISWNYAININNETEKKKVDFQVWAKYTLS